jgi:hypothetical protein
MSFREQRLLELQPLQLHVPGLVDPLSEQGLSEVYVRGADLVANYARTVSGQFTPQIYWRGRCTAEAAGVELIISMQTDQLHSDPTLKTTSQLPAGQLLQVEVTDPPRFRELTTDSAPSASGPGGTDPSLLLFRFASCPVSYAEMVYPTDLGCFWLRDRPAEQGGWQCGYRLLHENLEKGVIRRARLAGWLLPREEDGSTAVALFQSFLRSPLPLTT